MSEKLRTYIYVDGFNLYYRALKGTPFKWLDQMALYKSLLNPENEIELIRYYTANVSSRTDPDAPKRQRAYLSAITTFPNISIHKGRFLATKKWAGLADPPKNMLRPNPVTVRVLKTEEKGSDVNLASHLLFDSFKDLFDVAVVVSNDTDLVEPIRIVTEDMGKPVGLICPAPKIAGSLEKVASFVRHVSASRLKAAQLPETIPGTEIKKPETW